MWTPEFEAYVAPARVKPQIWRIIVGTLLATGIYVGVTLLTFAVVGIVAFAGAAGGASGPDSNPLWLLEFSEGRNPVGVIVLLLTFGGMLLGAFAATRWLHGRPVRTLFGPRLIATFVPAAVITLALGLGSLLLPFGDDITLVPNTPLSIWLVFFPAALVALAIQTGAEELLFRGYLQQQLAARFRSPIVWMLFPSVLFGALHIFGGDGSLLRGNWHLIFAATGMVGLLAADLTRVTGGIGAAWGLHFANNVQALLIVSLPDLLSGLSLYHTPFGPDDTDILPMLLVQDMVLLVIIWASIRLWLARRAA